MALILFSCAAGVPVTIDTFPALDSLLS